MTAALDNAVAKADMRGNGGKTTVDPAALDMNATQLELAAGPELLPHPARTAGRPCPLRSRTRPVPGPPLAARLRPRMELWKTSSLSRRTPDLRGRRQPKPVQSERFHRCRPVRRERATDPPGPAQCQPQRQLRPADRAALLIIGCGATCMTGKDKSGTLGLIAKLPISRRRVAVENGTTMSLQPFSARSPPVASSSDEASTSPPAPAA